MSIKIKEKIMYLNYENLETDEEFSIELKPQEQVSVHIECYHSDSLNISEDSYCIYVGENQSRQIELMEMFDKTTFEENVEAVVVPISQNTGILIVTNEPMFDVVL